MYSFYNRIRAYLFKLLNAKSSTKMQRMTYFSSFISHYDFDSLLDVGCGEGLLFDVIARFSKSGLLVGVDLVKNRTDRYEHVVASATKLPFRTATFSLVTAFSLVEHIPETKRKMFYKEASRVIKERGVLVIQLPNRYAIIESHTYLPFFGFLPSGMHSFAYRGGFVAVPSLNAVINSLNDSGFEVRAVQRYEAPFLPFGSFLGRIGLFHLFPMGYVLHARVKSERR